METIKSRVADLAYSDRHSDHVYCRCRSCKSVVRGSPGRLFCRVCNTQNGTTPTVEPTHGMRVEYVKQRVKTAGWR